MDHSSWRRECHVATTLCLGQDRLSLGGGGRTALGQVFHGVHGRSVLDAEEQLAVSDSVPCFKMVGFVAALVQALQSPGKLIFTRRLVGFRHSVSVDDKGKKVLGLVMIASTVGNRTLMVDSVDVDRVLNGALPVGVFSCLVQSKPNRLVLAGHFVGFPYPVLGGGVHEPSDHVSRQTVNTPKGKGGKDVPGLVGGSCRYRMMRHDAPKVGGFRGQPRMGCDEMQGFVIDYVTGLCPQQERMLARSTRGCKGWLDFFQKCQRFCGCEFLILVKRSWVFALMSALLLIRNLTTSRWPCRLAI